MRRETKFQSRRERLAHRTVHGLATKWDRPRRGLLRALVLVGVVALVFVAGQMVDIETHVEDFRTWLRTFGVWAPAVFVLAYAVATAAGVPGTPLTILAAVVFGPWIGVATMIAATSLAATAGFALARFVLHDGMARVLSGRPVYEKLTGLVEASPWTAIPFVRLMPAFPFTLVNYGLGLSRVSFRRYFLASELAMVPMNFVWVFSAGSIYAMVIRGETPWAILLGSALASLAVLGLTWFLRIRVGPVASSESGAA